MKAFLKLIIWILLILLIITGIIIGSLPMILSSRSGIALLSSELEKRYGGSYSIDDLTLSWGKNQTATGVKMTKGRQTLMVDQIRLNMSLFEIFSLRNHPLELLFSGEMEMKNGTILVGQHVALTHIEVMTDNAKRSITVKGETQTETGEKGKLFIVGKERNPWSWRAYLSNFPSQIANLFFPSIPFVKLIGSSLKLDFSLQDNTVSVAFSSPKLSFKTKGKCIDGHFYPDMPSRVSYLLDPAASDIFFAKTSVKPISAQRISAIIQPHNTHFRYSPFMVESITISSMELDLGKMLFRNFGALSDLLMIIELKLKSSQDVPIWFQPMPLTFEKGVATITRTEMLVDDKYELGLFGKANFVNQTAKANIALTAQVLQKVFKIKTVGPTYTIVMPIDGPFDDMKIHKSKALKQIAQILLAEKAQLPILPLPTNPAPAARPPYPWNK